MELESEIAWCSPASLQLTSSACKEPQYKRKVLAKTMGIQVWPTVLLSSSSKDEDDLVMPPARLRGHHGIAGRTADRLFATNA